MDASFLRAQKEEWATLNMDAESSKTSVIKHQLTQHITQYSTTSFFDVQVSVHRDKFL